MDYYKEQEQFIKQKTKHILWQLKYLIMSQGTDLKQQFQQYSSQGLMYFQDFAKLIRFIDNQIEMYQIKLIFDSLDTNKDNSINYFELNKVFNQVDMEKDSPFNQNSQENQYQNQQQHNNNYQINDKDIPLNPLEDNQFQQQKQIHKQSQQQEQYDPYLNLLKKFEKLQEKHQKNEINLLELIEIYSQGQKQIPINTIFVIMEICELPIKEKQEQYELYQLLGDQPIDKNILINEFFQIKSNSNNINNNTRNSNQQQQQQQPQRNQINNNPFIQNNNFQQQQHNNNRIQNNNNLVPPNPMQDMTNNMQQLKLEKRQSSNGSQSQLFNFEDFYSIDQMLPGIDVFINIFNHHLQANVNFVDPDFPPSHKSISDDPNDYRYYPQRNKYIWLRANELFRGKISVFQKCEALLSSRIGMGKYISPYDIKQGQLGDCYFLSALSSMADKPDRILKLFVTKIYNQIGVYCIKFCHDGEWKIVTIDDYFPCYNKYSGPAFSKANGNELWVLLMEKAYAKLYGSYQRLESGHNIEAFSDLTGAPSYNIHTMDSNGNINDKLYEELTYALEFGDYMVTAGTSDEIDNFLQEQVGLIGSHAYTILKILNIQHPVLGQTTLIKIRNPWGKKEWKGDFSDKSSLWTPELKNEVNFQNKHDGIFYMTLLDFQKYFSYCAICCYHDMYEYTSLRVKSNWKNSVYFRFQVKKEGLYYITITQKSKRNFPRQHNYEYSKSRLFLAKILPDNSFKYIESKQKQSKDTMVSGNLTAGTYYIQAKVEWIGDKQQEFVLGGYGPEQIQFEQIQKNYVPQMIESSLKQKASASGQLKPYNNCPYIQKCQQFDIKSGFGYVYVTNQSERTIDTTFTISDFYGIKIKKPFRNMNIQLYVMPYTDAIGVFTIDLKGYQYKIGEKYYIK